MTTPKIYFNPEEFKANYEKDLKSFKETFPGATEIHFIRECGELYKNCYSNAIYINDFGNQVIKAVYLKNEIPQIQNYIRDEEGYVDEIKRRRVEFASLGIIDFINEKILLYNKKKREAKEDNSQEEYTAVEKGTTSLKWFLDPMEAAELAQALIQLKKVGYKNQPQVYEAIGNFFGVQIGKDQKDTLKKRTKDHTKFLVDLDIQLKKWIENDLK